MATVDKDSDQNGSQEIRQKLPAFLRYPQDRIDFGYEMTPPAFSSLKRRPGPEGLSLVARVYE
ncbi:hypothetical protein [Paracoccus tegillarcae]|uniref:Uncharacterized protein n=1 Tax=Paracoccus tegillarcae TaxID=1529068 RepID=A0A2K9ESY2_9RHOB|nr:hypothetical protein [Paracoccus tegillarcae]AUH34845.1 hypothetical protein CUV01_16970 [Paracoccus tegillarcae]